MSQKVLVSLDLAGNQVLGLRLENLAADPPPFGVGHMYQNTVTGLVRRYDGTSWTDFGAATGSGDMLASTYDPTGVADDAFNTDNMVNGTTTVMMLLTERNKLTGIEDNATANDTDANLLNRGNHTGTQVAATISDLTAAVDALIDARMTGAPAAYDTFLEIANEMAADDSAAAAMAADIATKTGKYSEAIGDGTATAIVVTHSLGTSDVVMSVRELLSNDVVICDMQATSTNTATFTFASAPGNGAYIATIIG